MTPADTRPVTSLLYSVLELVPLNLHPNDT